MNFLTQEDYNYLFPIAIELNNISSQTYKVLESSSHLQRKLVESMFLNEGMLEDLSKIINMGSQVGTDVSRRLNAVQVFLKKALVADDPTEITLNIVKAYVAFLSVINRLEQEQVEKMTEQFLKVLRHIQNPEIRQKAEVWTRISITLAQKLTKMFKGKLFPENTEMLQVTIGGLIVAIERRLIPARLGALLVLISIAWMYLGGNFRKKYLPKIITYLTKLSQSNSGIVGKAVSWVLKKIDQLRKMAEESAKEASQQSKQPA